MNLNELFRHLKAQGIKMAVKNGKLKMRATKGPMDDETLSLIKQHKDAIMAKLSGTGKLTPSDFPSANVSQQELDDLHQQYPALQRLYISTPLQEGMLYHGLVDGTGESYTTQFRFNLKGELNLSAFKKAWRNLVKRYDIFRSCFVGFDQKQIHQLVHNQVDLPFVELDWRGEDSASHQQMLSDYQQKDKALGIDFSKAPLMRISLIQLTDHWVQCIWTHHHTVLDGWSFPIVFSDLLSAYQAYCQNEQPQLPVVDSYEHYINWLCKQDRAAAEAFWAEQLAGIESATPLMGDRLQSSGDHQGYQTINCSLDRGISDRLQQLTKQTHVTMNVLVQAAWSIVLHSYSGESSVVFGTIVSGRPSDLTGVESMVGLFINTIPVRVDINKNDTIGQLLAVIHSGNFERSEQGYMALQDIQHHTDIAGGESMFDSLVVFENYPMTDIKTGEAADKNALALTDFHSEEENNFLINMTALVQQNQLQLTLGYQSKAFLPATAERVLQQMVQLLTQLAVGDVQDKVSSLSLLSDADKQQLLHSYNDTERDYPQSACIHQLFEAQAAKQPDHIAVKYGDQSLTFNELNQQANQLAHYLVAQDVTANTLVGLCVERSVDMMVGLLGILKAGGAYVPIDPEYPQERIDYMLEDTEIELMLTQRELMSELEFDELAVMPLDSDFRNSLLSHFSTDNLDCDYDSSQLAYVIYTSGSTGTPKGVMVTHQNVVRLVRDSHYVSIDSADVVAQAANIAFDAATFEIWSGVCNGATVVYIDKDDLLDPARLDSQLEADGITVLFITTAVFNQVVFERPACFARLSCLLFGGEQVNYETVQTVLDVGKPAKLLHVYGPTETTTFSTFAELSGNYTTTGRLISIGGPLSNVQTYVLDQSGELLPMGGVGELCIGGRGVARGYLNQPQLTAEKFIDHPFSDEPGERLYKTGDLVRWLADGSLDFVGRVDHQVKVRGFRVELGEIEHQLTAISDVKEAIVIAAGDAGQTKRLVAYVVATNAMADDQQTEGFKLKLQTRLQGQLPSHMVPALFVVLPTMPLTPNGKIDRKALPVIDSEDMLQVEYVAPSNEMEQALCEIFQEVLGLEKVGVKDNFFAIGGDSILSIRILSMAKGAGITFSVKDIFKHQSIHALVEQINTDGLSDSHTIEVTPLSLLTDEERAGLPVDHQQLYDDVYPMSELQLGMVFHTQMDESKSTYNCILSYRVDVPWNEQCFSQALSYMFAKHPVLRSSYQLDCPHPLQFVNKSITLPLVCGDISHLTEQQQSEFISDWVEQQKPVPFDWAGPLFKVFIHKRSEQSIELGIVHHHAVYDGWSEATFTSQLFIHYHHLLNGKPLPELEVDYAFREFVALENQALNSVEAKTYWQALLEDAPQVQLPRLRPTGEQGRGQGVKLFSVGDFGALSGRLIALAKKLGVPMQSVLLAGHSKVMSMLSGQSKAIAAVVSNGRPERSGGENGLGLFLNSIPVCCDLVPGSWHNLIRAVATRLSDCMAYRHYPSSAIQRDTGRNFSEVLFNYTHFHAYGDTAEGVEEGEGQMQGTEGNEQTNYDFTIAFTRSTGGEQMSMNMSYYVDVYDDDMIARAVDYYLNVFNAMLNDGEQLHQHSLLIGAAEQQQLHLGFNDNKQDYPETRCIHQWFEQQAAKTPDNIAVSAQHHQLSYQALNQQANQLAHYLIEQGVTPDTLVGLCLTRSVDMMVGLLGILKSGGAYVPIDPNYPQSRIDYLLNDAQVTLLVTEQAQIPTLPETDATHLCLDQLSLSGYSIENPDTAVSANHLAYVIYTSGSTGQPKGVCIEHQSVSALLNWANRQYTPQQCQRVLASTSVCFDLSIFEMFYPLSCGGQILIVKDLLSLIDEPECLPTLINTVPSALKSLLESNALPASVTVVNVAGEPLRKGLVNQVFEQQNVKAVYNLYGPSEDTTYSTVAKFTGPVEVEPTIGQPIDNTTALVLNEHGQLTPQDGIGQLYIGGAGLARGYHNRADLTADKFVTSALNGERLYQTGDLVRRLEDGKLVFVGRVDNQVKVRGFRIELGEIEQQLLSCPDVKEVAVIVRSDENTAVVGYVVPDDIDVVDKSALSLTCRDHLQTRLPEHMVPSVFVVLPALPLTANGKIDRNALPSPESSDLTRNPYVAPTNDMQQKLCDIWQNVLGIEQVGINDNFFHLGGHSLVATRLVGMIRQTLQIELPMRIIFERPTVEGMASFLALDNGLLSVPAIEVLSERVDLPLSFAQQRLWFIDQLESGSIHYNQPSVLTINGQFDLAAFEQAMGCLLERHETLRTCFVEQNGQVGQVVQSVPTFVLQETLLSALPESKRAQEVQRLAGIEAQNPFDLTQDLMLRAQILTLSSDERVLLLTTHHIAFDGWSMGIFTTELSALYNAFVKGGPNPLTALPVQYADYATWQRNWLQGEVLTHQLDYWRTMLADLVPVHNLPLDQARPAQQSFNGASTTQHIDGQITKQINQLCQDSQVTLFMLLQSALAVLIARYSNETDIVIGSPIAGRTQAEVEPLIGFFVNTLVLRSDLSGDLTFDQLLENNKQRLLDAYAHQHIPFEMLVEELHPQRSLSHSPLFQIMLTLQNNAQGELGFEGFELAQAAQDNKASLFDLDLVAVEHSEGLMIHWSYNTDLFTQASINRFSQSLNLILSAIVANPQTRISALPLLSEIEKSTISEQWNQTAVEYPQTSIHQLFEQQAQLHPDNTALVRGSQHMNYQTLNQRANQLAGYLLEQGIKSGDLVGLCVERSFDMVIAMLAILKAGGAYLPIDAKNPQSRIDYLIADAKVTLVLTQQKLAEALTFNAEQTLLMDAPDIVETLGHYSSVNLAHQTNVMANVIYTSGSTGLPKGVSGSHRSIVNRLCWLQKTFNIIDEDVFCQKTRLSFVDHVAEIFQPLIAAKPLVILSDDCLLDMPMLIEQLQHHRISRITLVPSLLQELLVQPGVENLKHLKYVTCSGEVLPAAMVELFGQRMPSEVQLLNFYGSTEVTADVTYQRVDTTLVNEWQSRIGRPIDNAQVYVLDNQLNVQPVNVVGELCVSGDCLAMGYLHQPELTDEKFITHPLTKTRLFKTGDLARWLSDGTLELMGRVDHQVKIRGFRIELGEIEHQLNAIEEVKQAVVLVASKQLVAYLVSAGQNSTLIADCRAHLSAQLPDYMMPALFEVLPELPLSATGKVDRKALPEPDFSQLQTGQYVAPGNDIEQQLCELWQQLLGLEQVGVTDNFFELGGHSLLATRLFSLIRQTFAVELPIRVLFEQPTVAGLALVIEQHACGNEGMALMPPIVVAEVRDNLPLSFAQQRLWFIDQMGPSIQYNQPSVMSFGGELNLAGFEQALSQLIDRHDALRTQFIERDGQVIQTTDNAPDFALVHVDLSHLQGDAQQTQLNQLAQDEAVKPFDLSQDLMLRASIVSLSKVEHILLLTTHHIASDGWSLGIFTRELSVLYNGIVRGEPVQLAALSVQYADYAKWQRDWLQGEVLDSQLDYWQQRLTGIPVVHNLPLDRPRPLQQTHTGAAYSQILDNTVHQQLKALCQQQGVTLFMLLQTAFSVLLGRYGNETDVVIGSPIAGRTQSEVEPLIGFFVNTLVLRSDMSGNPSFNELLAANKQHLLDAYAHQQIPFEMLVEQLKPQRSMRHSPLFQVMLTLHNNQNSDIELDALTFTPVERPQNVALFELELNVLELDEGMVLNWAYNSDLFDGSTIERLAQSLLMLLGGIIDAPQTKVQSLPLVSEAQSQLLLEQWCGAVSPVTTNNIVHQLFEQQVSQTPDAIAVIDGDQSLSYRALNAKSNQLARYLSEQGAGPDTLVGLCVERSFDMVAGILAILKAGGAYVPIDPHYPQSRIDHIVDDSAIDIVLTQQSLQGCLPATLSNRVCLDVVELTAYSDNNLDTQCTDEQLAYVIYTSGSTGLPKGVCVTHNNVSNYLTGIQKHYHIDASDRVLQFATVSFDACVEELFGTLAQGATLVLRDDSVLDGGIGFWSFINTHQITVLPLPTAFWQLMVSQHQPSYSANHPLRLCIIGGEAVQASKVKQWLETFDVTLLNTYGPSETTVVATVQQLNMQGPVAIGNPVDNYRALVLDEHQALVPVGVVGELYIGGGSVARGYLNQPELTAQKFIADPFSDDANARLYKTDDLVRWLPSGQLDYVGRTDNQVKIRGFRVELGEVEQQLLSCPEVKDCVVLARDIADSKQLVAYVVATTGGEKAALTEQWRSYLRLRLANYQMPAIFINLDALPLTSNGKVDHKALPVPTDDDIVQTEYVAAQNEVQQTLCELFQGLLGLERVGIEDNFFDLGGHSLLATRLNSEIRRQFELELALTVVFENPTVNGLSAVIEQKQDYLATLALSEQLADDQDSQEFML